jgi:hypothetical protein
MSNLPNFKDYCEVARLKLWGKPDHSTARELRWNGADAYCAKTFNRRTKLCFEHGEQRGGSTLELVAYSKGQPKRDLKGAAFFEEWRAAHEMGLVPDPPPERRSGKGNGAGGAILATYPYRDENGRLLFEVVKFDTADRNQRFRQRRPDGNGAWMWSVKGVRQVPYRLPELIEALSLDRPVFIVEGEKDVDRFWSIGVPATCNAGGAGKWKPDHSEWFEDADVIVIPDNDPQTPDEKTGALMLHPDGRGRFPGQDHARDVAFALKIIAKRVRVLDLKAAWPEMPLKGDVSDWLDYGGSAEALYALAESLPDWTPRAASAQDRTNILLANWVTLNLPPREPSARRRAVHHIAMDSDRRHRHRQNAARNGNRRGCRRWCCPARLAWKRATAPHHVPRRRNARRDLQGARRDHRRALRL